MKARSTAGGWGAYIVIIGMSHFEAATSLMASDTGRAVRHDVTEGMAASPLATTTSDIPLHGVMG